MAEEPEYITKFMQAVYPGYDALAMATGTTESALVDATECISDLRSRVRELEDSYAERGNQLIAMRRERDDALGEVDRLKKAIAEHREPTPEED